MPKVAENGPMPFLAQSVVPKVAENGPVPFLAQSVVPKVAENGPVPFLAQFVVCRKWLKTVLCHFWHNLLCAKSG